MEDFVGQFVLVFLLAYVIFPESYISYDLKRKLTRWSVYTFILAVMFIYYQISLYTLIELPVTASRREIQRKISLLEAQLALLDEDQTVVQYLNTAKDILLSDASRQAYNLFGDFQYGKLQESGKHMVLIMSLSVYTLLAALTYAATIPKKFQSARLFIFSTLALFLFFEVCIRYAPKDIYTAIFGDLVSMLQITAFEIVRYSRAIFPLIAGSMLALSATNYVDNDAIFGILMRNALMANATMVPKLRELLDANLTLLAARDKKKGKGENKLESAGIELMKDKELRGKLQDKEGKDGEEVGGEDEAWTEFTRDMTDEQKKLSRAVLGRLWKEGGGVLGDGQGGQAQQAKGGIASLFSSRYLVLWFFVGKYVYESYFEEKS